MIRYHNVRNAIGNFCRGGIYLDPGFHGCPASGGIDLHTETPSALKILQRESSGATKIQNTIRWLDVGSKFERLDSSTDVCSGVLPSEIPFALSTKVVVRSAVARFSYHLFPLTRHSSRSQRLAPVLANWSYMTVRLRAA